MKKLLANDFIRLIPFLIIYSFICLVFSQEKLVGDEIRYLTFAQNLTKGFYSPQYPDMNIWNGPGYPILLVPFVYLKLAFIYIRLLNAFLLYMALVFTYKSLSSFTNRKLSFFLIIATGLYFPVFQSIPFILTESLSWFLISLSCYFILKFSNRKGTILTGVVLPGAILAYLALTKIIFVYALLVVIILLVVYSIFAKRKSENRRFLWIFLVAIIFCMPYIGYTYKLTGRLFYISNSGGISVYTFSSPAPDETGEWKSTVDLQKTSYHRAFIDSISGFQPLEMDDAYRNKAFQNIIAYPEKVFNNWIANVGRLFFSYPFAYSKQSIDTYFTIVPNMFLVVFILITLPVFLLNFKKSPIELRVLFVFIIIYLAGCSIVSAYSRMFYITVPFWIIYFQFVFTRLIIIRLNPE